MFQDKESIAFLTVLLITVTVLLTLSGKERERDRQNLTPEREIEVSCETPQGWVTYRSHIPNARNGRGGWYITTLNEQVVRATNCVTSYPKEWK